MCVLLSAIVNGRRDGVIGEGRCELPRVWGRKVWVAFDLRNLIKVNEALKKPQRKNKKHEKNREKETENQLTSCKAPPSGVICSSGVQHQRRAIRHINRQGHLDCH